MKLKIKMADYCQQLRDRSNEPLTLNSLTLPFGMPASKKVSEDLMVGHVIDSLSERYSPEDRIDCLDVAAAAIELGCEDAEEFLEEAPVNMYLMIRENNLERYNN